MEQDIYAITEETLDDFGSDESLTATKVAKDKKKEKKDE